MSLGGNGVPLERGGGGGGVPQGSEWNEARRGGGVVEFGMTAREEVEEEEAVRGRW